MHELQVHPAEDRLAALNGLREPEDLDRLVLLDEGDLALAFTEWRPSGNRATSVVTESTER